MSVLTLLGRLDDVVTSSGYRIAPYVGRIESSVDFQRQPAEVAEIILVPIEDLEDQHDGRNVEFYYGDERIWGATGEIVSNFLQFR